jgi:hypothetical protein
VVVQDRAYMCVLGRKKKMAEKLWLGIGGDTIGFI